MSSTLETIRIKLRFLNNIINSYNIKVNRIAPSNDKTYRIISTKCDTGYQKRRDQNVTKEKYNDRLAFVCEQCKEGIYNGERYYEINNKHYHRDCLLDNFSTSELLELMKSEAKIAYEDLI